MTTTKSLGDSSSFKSDEDGGELGHLTVSVSELNQLRQHVRDMRKNMTIKNRQNLAPAADNVSVVLEEVDLNGSRANGPCGLVKSEENQTPEEKRRWFRLAVISNVFFMLGAILYVCVAHGDLQWAKGIQGIPVDVLTADDDATWNAFKARQAASQPPRKLAGGMRMDEDQDFNNVLWDDLPPDIQLALMILGHNEHTWDAGMTSSIEEEPWDKLTSEEKDAAMIIGYTAKEWDEEEEEMDQMWEATQQAYFNNGADDDQADDDQNVDDKVEDDRVNDDKAQDDDVPDDDLVDNAEDDGTPQDDTMVDDGVADDLADATVITTSPTASPTGNPTASPTASPSTVAPDATYDVAGDAIPAEATETTPAIQTATSPEEVMLWGDYGWEDIPPQYQEAYEILGYNEELWNTGGLSLTEDLTWDFLTQAQQEQAVILGFNQALWNQVHDGDYDTFTGRKHVKKSIEKSVEETDPEPSKGVQYPIASDVGDDDSETEGDIDPATNTMMLFFAAFSFVIVGLLNWFRERQVFQLWLVQGGVWGALSALTMSFDTFASLVMQAVSAHCFLLQAIFMLRLRKTIRPVEGLERMSYAMWGADILFFIGSLIQCIVVYVMLADDDAFYGIGVYNGEVCAAWFWLFVAAIYSYNTMALANKSLEEDARTRTLTITRQHKNGETYTIRPAAIQLRENHSVVLT